MTDRSASSESPGRSRSGFSRFGLRLGLVCVLHVFSVGCISIDLLAGGDAPMQQMLVEGETGPKILLVEIDGLISGASPGPSIFGLGEGSLVARVREVLDRAREDEAIRAVLLRIDSPGGTATASEQVYREILDFKRERDVPVFAQLLTTAASGGYFVAMAADEVQAHPTSVVGSIGVIFTSVNFAGLMEKLGIEDQTITGGEFKDIGSPFRPLTAVERAQLQAIVDDLHARFREIVASGRPNLSPERVRALSDGRIFSAEQALASGLVDRVGGMNDAIATLSERIGATEVRIVAYDRPGASRRNVYMRAPAQAPALHVGPAGGAGLATLLGRPGFHYLWWPGLGGLQ